MSQRKLTYLKHLSFRELKIMYVKYPNDRNLIKPVMDEMFVKLMSIKQQREKDKLLNELTQAHEISMTSLAISPEKPKPIDESERSRRSMSERLFDRMIGENEINKNNDITKVDKEWMNPYGEIVDETY